MSDRSTFPLDNDQIVLNLSLLALRLAPPLKVQPKQLSCDGEVPVDYSYFVQSFIPHFVYQYAYSFHYPLTPASSSFPKELSGSRSYFRGHL